MPRYVTPSQYNAYIRRLNQEIDRVNRHNRQVVENFNRQQRQRVDVYNRFVDEYNRWARNYNQTVKTAVSNYNQAVRTHNAQIQSRRQRLLSALRSSSASASSASLRTSTFDLNERFDRVAAQTRQVVGESFVTMAEREVANSLATVRALEGADDAPDDEVADDDREVVDCLNGLSADLKHRWEGAVFALSPRNPDAARHFCTSVREVVISVLDLLAPDHDVVSANPSCERQQHNDKPTRRAKIHHLLRIKGVQDERAIGFVDADVTNILELFSTFNAATHGPAGTHDYKMLQTIKQRVKGGIMFLAGLAVPS